MADATQKTVVLAFSGGLDTSYCLVHLRELGWDVVTVTVDTGGFSDAKLTEISARAAELGTSRHITIDARTRFYDEFVANLIRANYLRGGGYPSCTGSERVVVASEAARTAVELGADAIAHGSSGAGNDHVRFDVTIRAEARGIEILAPIRDGEVIREAEVAELAKRGYGTAGSAKTDGVGMNMAAPYSTNEGMAGGTIGGVETDGSWEYLPEHAWETTAAIADAPDAGIEVVIDFAAGLPVSLSGEGVRARTWTGPDLLNVLAGLAAKNAVGRGIHLGTTIMGFKGRVGFEAPGMLVVIAAHRELERLTLTNRQIQVKDPLGNAYGDLLHEGLHGDPVACDIEALLASSQARVEGAVRVRLVKGNIIVLGSRSPYSLLDSGRRLGSTYGHSSTLWTGSEARAFAKIYGLQAQIAAEAARGNDELP